MTDTELNELDKLAKAATSGRWSIDERNCEIVVSRPDMKDIAEAMSMHNGGCDAAFIAAANPATIISLIAELRQARKERDWVIRRAVFNGNLCHRHIRDCGRDIGMGNNCVECWQTTAKEATC